MVFFLVTTFILLALTFWYRGKWRNELRKSREKQKMQESNSRNIILHQQLRESKKSFELNTPEASGFLEISFSPTSASKVDSYRILSANSHTKFLFHKTPQIGLPEIIISPKACECNFCFMKSETIMKELAFQGHDTGIKLSTDNVRRRMNEFNDEIVHSRADFATPRNIKYPDSLFTPTTNPSTSR
ncbi:hypothetical protein HK096_009729, partial [Nowakowskiella sp. JEL0078]